MQDALNAPSAKLSARPFAREATAFMRRTAVATVATALIVAGTAAARFDPAWGWRYLQAALWSLVFFALTPLILKVWLTDQRKRSGLILILLMVLKVAWMGLMCWLCSRWLAGEKSQGRLASSVLGGVLTPLAVAVLRLVGKCLKQTGVEQRL